MTREEAIQELKYAQAMFLFDPSTGEVGFRNTEDKLQHEALEMAIKALQKNITTNRLEEMYEKYTQYLWKYSEDVLGNDMIEVGYAEEYIAERLREFGCWYKEEEESD